MAQSRRSYSRVVAVVVMVAGLAALLGANPPAAAEPQSLHIHPEGQDLVPIVDAATTATTFYLHGQNGDPAYRVSAPLRLNDGDELIGDAGTFIERGPAFDPQPTVSIEASEGVSSVIRAEGKVHLEWVKIVGGTGQAPGGTPVAGTGVGLGMGKASDDSSVYAVHVTGSDAAGISNAHGTFERVELNDTTQEPNFLGFTGAGLKAVNEVEVKNSYVHDNQGNGLWCDEYCDDAEGQPNGFWIHDNLVVKSGRAGVRYEKVGDLSTAGEALIERNEVHQNSQEVIRGGIDIRDAQDALVRENVFGGKSIVDATYSPNAGGVAIRASDSGRSDRPDLRGIRIVDNAMNGETVQGCELPDEIVACSSTVPETTIDSGPGSVVNSTSASFGFSSSAAGSTFECSLDDAPLAACVSPEEYADLPEGEHTFEVTAVGVGGTADPTPARHTWTVDTVAPGAPTITSPQDNSYNNTGGVTLSGAAEPESTVEVFDGTASVGTTRADAAGAWSVTLGGVPDGQHVYIATATDAATNTSPPSNSRTVIADTAVPAVVSVDRAAGTTNPTNAPSVSWDVTFGESVAGVDASDFRLTNEGGGLGGTSVAGIVPFPGSNGTAYGVTANTGSGNGSLRLDLIDDGSISDPATNPLGGPGAGNGNFTTGQSYAIDRVPPTVTIDSTSPNTVGATGTSTITWRAGENGPYSIRVGGTDCSTGTQVASGNYTAPNSVQTSVGVAFLSEGPNTIRVCVTDALGNVGSKTTTITKNSDTTAPRVTITLPAANTTGVDPATNVTATFSEDMNASTVNDTTFQLFKKGSTNKLAASVSYSASTDKATLDPASSLQRNVTYRALVSTGARDLAGNPLDQSSTSAGLQEMTWSFTVKK